MSKGIVIAYLKENRNYVCFDYYGKKRYLNKKHLICNDRISSFIRNNTKLFDVKLTALKSSKVYKNSSGKKTFYCVRKGDSLKSFGRYGQRYKVQIDGDFGYVTTANFKRTCLVNVVDFPRIVGSTTGEKMVNYAKNFIGNPYVWGGTSLTSGCDCSGFTQSVYKQFGYKLPRCSYQQATVGKKVSFSDLKPGDLIFYYRGGRIGHVTMYAGNGYVIQAQGRKYGITMTRYDYSKPAFARRIIGG